ncbi:MAG: transglycosylase SLT domain-containing protein [Treponema sp.]|nr:transglycosylase SLT domain-containing protein [Treponema sp.]
MHYKKIELKIPLFFGCLGSLVLCALLAIRLSEPSSDIGAGSQDASFEGVDVAESAGEGPKTAINARFFARSRPRSSDRLLELYRQPESRGYVIDFFAGISPATEIVEAVLVGADRFDISPALAFSLGWEESRLDPLAVNTENRDGSIDRGLFQLNNRSFPRLDLESFFNPAVNAYYAMGHLRYCLDTGGTEIAALAMYNAGAGRVSNTGTPKTTLDYISRILENRRELESRFFDWESQFLQQLADGSGIAGAEQERSRFAVLRPLGIR